MQGLSRRSSLLLPLLLAACEGTPRSYPPLRYGYLTPFPMNVAEVRIEQRFVPSGGAPDVSGIDPMPPVQALRNMADDRLQALGGAGQAVFVIRDASLVRHGDTILGNFAVELDIYMPAGVRTAYAEARVAQTTTIDDLPATLYDMTKAMMDRMNVEFEYQVRHSLSAWLLPAGALRTPVHQQPLTPPVEQQPLTLPQR